MTGRPAGGAAPSGHSRPRPCGIYGIADLSALGTIPPARAVAAMATAGVQWVQLRAKLVCDAELHRHAAECRRALEGTATRLWVNDRPDVAALVGADGVHLGQDDLPSRAARSIVGAQCWIGRSTHDRSELLEADADPDVDVIAVGPVFWTTGKDSPGSVVGLEHVRWARRATGKPLVAIGGIDATNLASVLAAGADAVAVIGALCRATDESEIEANARRLTAAAECRKEARA